MSVELLSSVEVEPGSLCGCRRDAGAFFFDASVAVATREAEGSPNVLFIRGSWNIPLPPPASSHEQVFSVCSRSKARPGFSSGSSLPQLGQVTRRVQATVVRGGSTALERRQVQLDERVTKLRLTARELAAILLERRSTRAESP